MKNMGIGKNYRYAHDEPNAYAAGENYFPGPLKEHVYIFQMSVEWRSKSNKNWIGWHS